MPEISATTFPATGEEGGFAAPGLPETAILTPNDAVLRAYTPEEIDSLFEEPRTVLDLLRNMKISWEHRLLVQQEFWRNKTLARFLGADKLDWQPHDSSGRPAATDGNLVEDNGYVLAHSPLIPAPITVTRHHHTLPAETASWVYAYPAHTESYGLIRFPVGHSQITWSELRELFGQRFINRGPPPPPMEDSQPHHVDPTTHMYPVTETRVENERTDEELDYSVCYVWPEGIEQLATVWNHDHDEICFGLRVGTKPLMEWHNGYRPRDPEDDDLVVSVSEVERFGHVPGFCSALKLDPAMEQWCPVRVSKQ